MMHRDVSQWFALYALLFGIGLTGCGTEIGNGWNEGDDKVQSNESRKDAAQPQNSNFEDDNDEDGSDGTGAEIDEPLDGDSSGGASTPQFSDDVALSSDVLLIPCASPFGDDIAEETYEFFTNEDKLQVAIWDADGWDLLKNGFEDPFRRITPDDGTDVITEQYIGAKIAPITFSYSCTSRESEEATVDAQNLRETKVTVILDNETFQLTWVIDAADDTLQSVTVTPDGKDPVEFTVEVLSQ